MEINQLKFVGKEQLIRKLNQNGYDAVAELFADKEVDGAKVLDGRFEFETIKWRLNPSQKKIVSNFLKDLKLNPYMLNDDKHKKPLVHKASFSKKFDEIIIPPVPNPKPQLPEKKKGEIPNKQTLSRVKSNELKGSVQSPVLPKRVALSPVNKDEIRSPVLPKRLAQLPVSNEVKILHKKPVQLVGSKGVVKSPVLPKKSTQFSGNSNELSVKSPVLPKKPTQFSGNSNELSVKSPVLPKKSNQFSGNSNELKSSVKLPVLPKKGNNIGPKTKPKSKTVPNEDIPLLPPKNVELNINNKNTLRDTRSNSVASYISDDDIPRPPPPLPSFLYNKKTNNFKIAPNKDDFQSKNNCPSPERKPLALPRVTETNDVENDEEDNYYEDIQPPKNDNYLDLEAKKAPPVLEKSVTETGFEMVDATEVRIYENVENSKENTKPKKGGFLSMFSFRKPKAALPPSDDVNKKKVDISNTHTKRPLPSVPTENESPAEDDENLTDYEDLEEPEQEYTNLPSASTARVNPAGNLEDLVTKLRGELERRKKIKEQTELNQQNDDVKRNDDDDENVENEYNDIDEIKESRQALTKNYQFYKPPVMAVKQNEKSDDEDDEEEEEIYFQPSKFDVTSNPYFRDTNRKGARNYLKNLQDGAFLFRPSKKYFLGLTVKHNGNYYDLGIQKKQNNKIQLDAAEEDGSPEFINLKQFVDHFMKESITFEANGEFVDLILNPSPLPKKILEN